MVSQRGSAVLQRILPSPSAVEDLYYHWNHQAFRELVQRLSELFESLVLKLLEKLGFTPPV